MNLTTPILFISFILCLTLSDANSSGKRHCNSSSVKPKDWKKSWENLRSHKSHPQKVQEPGKSKKRVQGRRSAKYSRSMSPNVPTSGIMNTFENQSYWAEKEEIIFQLAKRRLQKLEEEVQTLKEYIGDYESTTERAVKHSKQPLKTPKDRADFVASSGIASYRMTYRFVYMLQRLKELMAVNHFDTDLHNILWQKSLKSSKNGQGIQYYSRSVGGILPNWPNRFDLALAMHSLIHIQEVYNYEYKDLPIVLSPKTQKPPQLNAFHCAKLGMYALYRKHYAVAIEWIEHAIEKVNNEYDLSISVPVLESYLELASTTHNTVREDAETSDYVSIENLFMSDVEPFKDSRPKQRITSYQLQLFGGRREYNHAAVNFNGICSGNDYRTPKERSSLYCWYDTNSSPARKILPYKKELLSLEPEVVQVYDFLGQNLMSKLINEKADCSGISHTHGEASYSEMMRTRTAATCWPKIPELKSFWKKVASVTLTDLRRERSHEPLQVADYLFGRLYAVHMDALQLTDEPATRRRVAVEGDRLFSMLFYLNDVPSGGSTPFCNAGIAALPVKGSVVIWKNLYRNGTARLDTWHGSCPVIYGRKQVAVALIGYNQQFRTYPCTLNQNE